MSSEAVRRRRVLIIDDELPVADFLRECLDADYVTEIATSGHEALDAAARTRPDVVLLDMHMPGLISGIDVLERLRAMHPSVRIILVTGTTNRALVARAMELGAFSYVPKPFKIQYVQHLVSAALTMTPGRPGHRVEAVDPKQRAVR